jgi:hypothetical protein
MPNALVEGFFLLAFWAPPLAVVVGALALLVKTPAPHRSSARVHTAALTH